MTKDGGDPFANPFALTSGDRRRLDQFFDDDDDDNGGEYEQVLTHDENDGDTEVGGGGGGYQHRHHRPTMVSLPPASGSGREHGSGNGHGANGDPEGARGRRRRRRGPGDDDDTLGSVLPVMFDSSASSSINTVYLAVLVSLLFFLGAYYGLSKKHNARLHEEADAAAAQLEKLRASAAGGAASGAAPKGAPISPLDSSKHAVDDEAGSGANGNEEGVGQGLIYDVDYEGGSPPKVGGGGAAVAATSAFDPFRLQRNKPTRVKGANGWDGAPFVVSPPRLPQYAPVDADGNARDGGGGGEAGGGGGSRLGYIQNPTMVGGTIVFSTEGDLYLARLPPAGGGEGGPAPGEPMAAMKLTTTVGNALHPKLNPRHPHLLVYSATYSGTREVYLMDLRPSLAPSGGGGGGGGLIGAPGTLGGPALRLTYTPGGIRTVVGWDEEGSSVLYSALGSDSNALPDVRLYRLRLSWSGEEKSDAKVAEDDSSGATLGNDGDGKAVVDGGDSEKGGDKGAGGGDDSGDDDDDDDDNYSIAEAQSYVDKMTSPLDSPPVAKESSTPENSAKGKGGDGSNKDDAHRQRVRRVEEQRARLARLSRERRSLGRRAAGSSSPLRSIIEPVPLAQATEGVYYTSGKSSDEDGDGEAKGGVECIYFTRFKQSSNTKRYVGGTAESLWGYCPDMFDDVAFPLTADYNGTSRMASVYYYGDEEAVLLFMSDRAPSTDNKGGAEWVASSMDLWAAPIPTTSSSSPSLGTPGPLVPTRLTNVACQHNGLDLLEYAVDPTGGIVLRIGADLHYMAREIITAKLQPESSPSTPQTPSIQPLPIAVYSDFSNMHERLIPLDANDIKSLDAYATPYGTVSTLLTARGQTFVAPVIENTKSIPKTVYGGGGRNMPARRYKVAPGTGGGGLVRILSAKHIPQPSVTSAPVDSGERLALMLATDPLSPTGEHAFYVVRTDAMASPAFGFAALYEYDYITDTGLPAPFLGGHLESGGSVKEGGLGSVYADSISISPCGRRFAWTDTDGRIVVSTIPTSQHNDGRTLEEVDVLVLPQENEIGQPVVGDSETNLAWSPGGRYLAIEHQARNQFRVISLADLGSPENELKLDRFVQATPDRFNSFSPVWGHASKDFTVDAYNAALDPTKSSPGSGATALIFLSDRDVKLTGKTSPWGTRAPSPTLDGKSCVHVLPLQSAEDSFNQSEINKYIKAPYGGGGASEISMEGVLELNVLLEAMQAKVTATAGDDAAANHDEVINETNSTAGSEESQKAFVVDIPISFGKEKDQSLSFARSSYRVDHIPEGKYVEIVAQLADDPSLLLLNDLPGGFGLSLYAIEDWPSDASEEVPAPDDHILQEVAVSSDGTFIITIQNNKMKVFPRRAKDALAFFSDAALEKNIADVGGLHLSVWPNLEYQQMYKDAWRMLRDYFYDPNLHSVDWDGVFDRYLPLVERCAKREELDDVLKQMIGELSSLHSFVYGGEYSSPHHGDNSLETINEVASLGAVLRRSVEKSGYLVVDIPARDPDLHMVDHVPMYSPLSNQVLRLTGQVGLKPGDVIVAVNGENVMSVPDIHMLLRNTAGESVRLDVLRLESTSRLRELRNMKRRLTQKEESVENEGLVPEPLIVVPMTSEESEDLTYAAWEWKTRESAKTLAAESGFTCGYIHLQSMSGASAMDSFVRGFYPDYDKDALIIDVRNNRGGNIDSWILDALQKRAWMYWESRSTNITNGGLGWDMQFAFRGHIVVLINEHTSSDGEGFARGVSELGLGKLVGTRTWGGGIWLSSDNHLVDGGIASAAEVGTYNDKFGWGLGIENMGVSPDVEVDNNPRTAYDGEDAQLEHAISVLKHWLEKEPVVLPKNPGARKDISKKVDGCSADSS